MKVLKKTLVLVLVVAMIVGTFSVSILAADFNPDDVSVSEIEEGEGSGKTEIISENTVEAELNTEDDLEPGTLFETNGVTCMMTSNGIYKVSDETAAVVESLETENYAQDELLVIYDDEYTAEVAAEVLPEVSEEVLAAEIIEDTSTVKITLDENASMEEQIVELSAEDGVEYVQPNYRYELIDEAYEYDVLDDAAEESMIGVESVNTNDPYRTKQLYLDQVKIQQAWNKVLATNYSSVKVAILDTGARVSHQDLTGSINKTLCVDVTGSTTVIKTTDDNGHGTQVSSMIGATANNGTGMAGAATCGLTGTNSPLEYFSVDVFRDAGGYSSDIAKGIRYAVDNGAKVINMSLGYEYNETTWTDTVFKNAIDEAWAANVICVCAAGNENNATPQWPSDYEKVIAVTALSTIYVSNYTAYDRGNVNYRRSYFSCYNANKDICAPGSHDFGAYKGSDSDYCYMSGTSQATPIVTSVVALMFMVNQDLTFSDVYDIITSTATDIVYEEGYADDGQTPTLITEHAGVGFDIYTGYGLINAEACVTAAIGHIHTKEHHAAVAATCTETGNIEYWYCTECKKYFTDEDCKTETTLEAVTIAKNPNNHVHTRVINEIEPTATDEGYSGDTYCDDCKKTVEIGKTVLAIGITVYNGVDYSAVYDYRYYHEKYSDLRKAYGNDVTKFISHFVNYGMSEGRQGKSTFNLSIYKNRYSDLRNAFGNNNTKYYLHYMNYGQKEGRIASLWDGGTVYNGVDYAAVYSFEFYSNRYSDLRKAFGDDQEAYIRHFVNCGMSEGRQAKSTFNVNVYKNTYSDLRKAYGDNLQKYYLHYISYGQKEGRKAY